MGFPEILVGKESACSARDPSSIPGLGRSSGEGKGNPLQYSGLENSKDCIVHGVAKSWTQLSSFHFHSHVTLSSSWQPVLEAVFQVLSMEDASQRANSPRHVPGAWDVEPQSPWPLYKYILMITMFSNLGKFNTVSDQDDTVRHRDRMWFSLHIKHCSQMPTLFLYKIQKLFLIFNDFNMFIDVSHSGLDQVEIFEAQGTEKVRASL